jgi:PKD domain
MTAKPGMRALAIAALGALLARSAEAITIVAPAAGVTVKPGDTITVTLTPDPAEGPLSAASVGMTTGAPVDGSPSATVPGGFAAQITVPVTLVGPNFIVAVAHLASGSNALDYVLVNVDPGPLRSLIVSAPPAMARIGQVATLDVQGLFEDGVIRNLTSLDRGTTYASSNQTVLGVHPNGLIQARTSGVAQLSVTNRGRTATQTIMVSLPSPPDNTIPIANAGPDQVVAPVTLVTLSAAASSDADGDALTYHWEQEDGRVVTLQASEAVQTTFVSPRVNAQEVLTFSLVVKDNHGASTFPVLVHVTVQP